jgi:hypothetical protein
VRNLRNCKCPVCELPIATPTRPTEPFARHAAAPTARTRKLLLTECALESMITENHAENGACKSPRSSKATNCERTAAKAADDTGILLRAQPRSVSTVGIPTPVQLYESTYWPYACPAVGGPYSYSCTPLLASTISQDSRRISDLSVSVQQPAGRLWSPDSWAHSSTAVVEMQGAGRRAQGAGRRAQGAGRRAQGPYAPCVASAGRICHPWENSTGMVTPAFLLDFGARASLDPQASENCVCTALRRHFQHSARQKSC